jgi:hypothetical protein
VQQGRSQTLALAPVQGLAYLARLENIQLHLMLLRAQNAVQGGTIITAKERKKVIACCVRQVQ